MSAARIALDYTVLLGETPEVKSALRVFLAGG